MQRRNENGLLFFKIHINSKANKMKKIILVLVIFIISCQSEEIKPVEKISGTFVEVEPTSNGVTLKLYQNAIYNDVWIGLIEVNNITHVEFTVNYNNVDWHFSLNNTGKYLEGESYKKNVESVKTSPVQFHRFEKIN